jgi:hypothetical protein
MNDINPRSNQTTFWVLWVLISIVGWAASHSALRIPSLNSARDIIPWAVADILDGALIGAIITFGQWLILLNIFPGFSRRFLATALLYPVGLLIGLVVFSFWGLAQRKVSMGMRQLGCEFSVDRPCRHGPAQPVGQGPLLLLSAG